MFAHSRSARGGLGAGAGAAVTTGAPSWWRVDCSALLQLDSRGGIRTISRDCIKGSVKGSAKGGTENESMARHTCATSRLLFFSFLPHAFLCESPPRFLPHRKEEAVLHILYASAAPCGPNQAVCFPAVSLVRMDRAHTYSGGTPANTPVLEATAAASTIAC